jgi:hypothetical protein
MTGDLVPFPFEQTVEKPTNDPRAEFVFAAVLGMPPARAKRLIMMARDPEIGLLDDPTAQILIDALDLARA